MVAKYANHLGKCRAYEASSLNDAFWMLANATKLAFGNRKKQFENSNRFTSRKRFGLKMNITKTLPIRTQSPTYYLYRYGTVWPINATTDSGCIIFAFPTKKRRHLSYSSKNKRERHQRRSERALESREAYFLDI
jgi:hypothetical protein